MGRVVRPTTSSEASSGSAAEHPTSSCVVTQATARSDTSALQRMELLLWVDSGRGEPARATPTHTTLAPYLQAADRTNSGELIGARRNRRSRSAHEPRPDWNCRG